MIKPFPLENAQIVLKSMKVLMYAPSFAGKTLSSLYMAAGIIMKARGCTEQEAYERVLLLDSEYSRGALYKHIGNYKYKLINPPYSTDKLKEIIEYINTLDNIDVIIIDSLTHFWSKDGGILDQKAAKDKEGGNSYTNWQDYTAIFNKLLDVILQSPKHIICTARAKSDTALVTNDKGKQAPKTYGLKPELRDGIDFEFDIVFNIDKESHSLIVEKAVPGMEVYYDIMTPTLGGQLYDLTTANAVVLPRTEEDVINSIRDLAKTHALVTFVQLELSGRKLDQLNHVELCALETKLLETIKLKQAK